MTKEEMIEQRRQQVRRMMRLTGEDFVQEILTNYRGADPAPIDDFCRQYHVTRHELCGRRWFKFKTQDVPVKGQTKKILYIHGGGFVLETSMAEYTFAGYLSDQTGAEVWFPEYPIAPERNCLDALEMVTKLYEMMLQETDSSEIAMMGASAGGQVAISAAMCFRDRGLPLPNSLTLYSPGIHFDLPETEEGKAYLALLESRDPLLSYTAIPTIGSLWMGDLPKDDYRGKPISGDLRGLPPMLFFSGTGEIFNLQAREFVQKARDQGAKIRYVESEMKPHCWLLFPDWGDEESRQLVVETLLKPPVE